MTRDQLRGLAALLPVLAPLSYVANPACSLPLIPGSDRDWACRVLARIKATL